MQDDQMRGPVEELTAFVGVRGSLAIHDWVHLDGLTEDAYSLFARRSAAMGWSDGTWTDSGRRIWSVVEAGEDWSGRTSPWLCWWQISLPAPHGSSSVPLQAILACAQACLDRLGVLDLTSVDLLVPLASTPGRLGQVVATSSWFGLASASARSRLEVTLDVGAHRQAPDPQVLLDALRRLHTQPFTFDQGAASAPGADAALAGQPWFAPSEAETTIVGNCPDWGLEAAGWVAELVAEVCRDLGCAGTARIGVRRVSTTR